MPPYMAIPLPQHMVLQSQCITQPLYTTLALNQYTMLQNLSTMLLNLSTMLLLPPTLLLLSTMVAQFTMLLQYIMLWFTMPLFIMPQLLTMSLSLIITSPQSAPLTTPKLGA